MKHPLSFLHRLWRLPTRPRTIVRRQPRTRLGLECLEDRLVPANVLTISGDQLAPNFNDHITINATSNGGLMVTLNGQTTTYNPGQFSSVSVNAGGGDNAIDILGTPSGVAINVDSVGIDTVTVGNVSNSVASHGSMSNIKGAVNVYGTGAVTLNVDDSGDSHGQAVSLKNGAVCCLLWDGGRRLLLTHIQRS